MRQTTLLFLAMIFLAGCGIERKNDRKPRAKTPATASANGATAGDLRLVEAIQSSAACMENYLPPTKGELAKMKNEFLSMVDSCDLTKFPVACVQDDLSIMSKAQIGFITWWPASATCKAGYSRFTDKQSAVTYLSQVIAKIPG